GRPPVSELDVFLEQRPRLFSIAYRMLGRATEAEDVLQEAYLRWQSAPREDVESAPAFLTSVVVRLSIDVLRSARVRREAYVGPWLPEPLVADTAPGPDEAAELADSVSLAFLVLLEELTPVERAVFLLREVFGYDYPTVAAMVGKSEANCRQLVVRGKQRVAERRTRFEADSVHGRELTARFLAACSTGDLDGLLGMLADDVVVWSDGGGKVQAARRPVAGRDKAARFLIGIAEKGGEFDGRLVAVNGQPGGIFGHDGRIEYAMALDVLDGQIVGVRVIANPDKLQHLQPQP
ncbi:MAG: polymerase sigma-70 factor, subfamily, partial [Frankiaceae bacterium]|nr:polymerase sigma-70 factor, subfamily [Frankiaceae bacterium]